jgi:ABC-type glycerol-3-phosphate transport system substrate-binding protein
MSRAHRGFILTLSIAIALGLLGTVAFAGAKAKLTLWGWDFRATKDIAPQVEAFKVKHPDVEVEALDMGPQDLFDKLLIAITSGTGAPDISFITDGQAFKYYPMGVLYPLTRLIPNWEREFVPAISYRWGYKGQLMGAPYDMGPFVIFYRKDVFDKLGIDFEKNVTSWDKFLEVGKKVTIPGQRYMSVFTNAAGSGQFTSIAWSAKAKVTSIDDELLFTNPRAIEVAQYMVDTVSKHKIAEYSNPFDAAGYEKVKSGRWIALPLWFWYQSFALKDIAYSKELDGAWRIARVPAWKEGDPPTGADFFTGGLFIVIKQTKYPDLATELAASLATKDAQVNQARSRGIFPVNVGAQEELARTRSDPFFGGQFTYKIGLDEMKDAMPMSFGPKWSVISDALNKAFDRMMYDNVPVKQALEDAKKDAEREMR